MDRVVALFADADRQGRDVDTISVEEDLHLVPREDSLAHFANDGHWAPALDTPISRRL